MFTVAPAEAVIVVVSKAMFRAVTVTLTVLPVGVAVVVGDGGGGVGMVPLAPSWNLTMIGFAPTPAGMTKPSLAKAGQELIPLGDLYFQTWEPSDRLRA